MNTFSIAKATLCPSLKMKTGIWKTVLTLCFSYLFLQLSFSQQPTLYLIGDSTMATKKDPETNPEHGWGQVLNEYFTDSLLIENHAKNGRSSKSFLLEGRWDSIMQRLKKGDFVMIQFGHNDQKFKSPDRYTNPATSYRKNLEKYITDTRAKGATPILLSSIVRRNFNEYGSLVDTHGLYPIVARMTANDLNVSFIDLQGLTEELVLAYGKKESEELYLHIQPGENDYVPEGKHDNTHLSDKGAHNVSELAVHAIIEQNLALKKFLTDEAVKDGQQPFSNQRTSINRLLYREDSWFQTLEAKRIADNILLYQKENGGWYKNISMVRKLSKEEKESLKQEKKNIIGTTIDNGATVGQIRYLARIYNQTKNPAYKRSVEKGIDYLLAAQYQNGGWPQFYPIREGYYEHITYNDNAMIRVMRLLKDIAKNETQYRFIDNKRKEAARKAIDKGLTIILQTQVMVNGRPTIWCAQHDKNSLLPAKARSYELPSLSGSESVHIVEYLMDIEQPDQKVTNAICYALEWFNEHKITGKEVKWVRTGEQNELDRVIIDSENAEPLWARFYEIQTGEPIFVGRDGIKKDHLKDIERERRVNYNYIDHYAADLPLTGYPPCQ